MPSAQLPAKPQPSSMPEIPERIGPYRILSKVGEGGMGVVYKAEDARLQRVVALKVIRGLDADAAQQQRFWQEARTAAQVAHPNACRIYDVAEDQAQLVLVMEFIEGESLAQIVLAILSALEAFHHARQCSSGRRAASRSGKIRPVALGPSLRHFLACAPRRPRQESLEACEELMQATFRDPEG